MLFNMSKNVGSGNFILISSPIKYTLKIHNSSFWTKNSHFHRIFYYNDSYVYHIFVGSSLLWFQKYMTGQVKGFVFVLPTNVMKMGIVLEIKYSSNFPLESLAQSLKQNCRRAHSQSGNNIPSIFYLYRLCLLGNVLCRTEKFLGGRL